jgi:curved DNA-binding protein CbpA
MKINYYEILGVPVDADADHIRRAYLEKVRYVHPDVNPAPEAHKAFILVKEAYDTLSNANKRAVYDQQVKQAATTQQNVKNFHYDFESNLGGLKNAATPGPNVRKVVLAVIIAFLLMMAGAIGFLMSAPVHGH